jgi:hypothetical protein
MLEPAEEGSGHDGKRCKQTGRGTIVVLLKWAVGQKGM